MADLLHSLVRFNYGTASVLEIAWTLVAMVGLVQTARNYKECAMDLDALRSMKDFAWVGPRHIVARNNIRHQMQNGCIFLVFLVIGAVSMTQAPRDGSNAPPTLGAVVLAAGLIALECLMMINSVKDARDRHRTMDFIIKHNQDDDDRLASHRDEDHRDRQVRGGNDP